MIVIGLAGGIGTGKSTVGRFLAELGAVVLDADKVGHEAYEPHTEIWDQVVATFGRAILKDGEQIDRAKLGQVVFHDPQARARLNEIMHPGMYSMVEKKLENLRQQGAGVVVLEAALLIEADWMPLVDEIWITVAPEAVVLSRLKDRSGLADEQVLARIRSQPLPEERLKYAQVVINTEGTLEEVREQVQKQWQRLRGALATAHG
ncbi:MAG: dephospho-CoA kinase [Chloroflexi bacterium]|nr:dephospho-CoA kinase [Chloroflexota bacterium]